MKNMTVKEVGYPDALSGHDAGTMKAASQICTVLGYILGTANFSLSCKSSPGASGSMIFAEKGCKEFVIAVVNGGYATYDSHHRVTGYITSAVSISQIIRTVDDKYRVDFEAKTTAFDIQYGPATRLQDQGCGKAVSN